MGRKMAMKADAQSTNTEAKYSQHDLTGIWTVVSVNLLQNAAFARFQSSKLIIVTENRWSRIAAGGAVTGPRPHMYV